MISPYCRDGIVQSEYGEMYDDGVTNNDGAYGHCTSICTRVSPCNEEVSYLDGGIVIRSGCL